MRHGTKPPLQWKERHRAHCKLAGIRGRGFVVFPVTGCSPRSGRVLSFVLFLFSSLIVTIACSPLHGIRRVTSLSRIAGDENKNISMRTAGENWKTALAPS